MSVFSHTTIMTPNTGRPQIRKCRNFTEDIKSACARVSIVTGMASKNARKAVQITCSELYHHDFYLSAAEQREKENGEVTTINSNFPHSKGDWENYEYVLPSENIIDDYRSLLAAQEEADAGKFLFDTKDCNTVTSTFHIDSTI